MNWRRMLAVLLKELRQVGRDRLTFGMMVGIPIMQLILFGFAINGDVRHLPLAVADLDRSVFSRRLVAALETSQYFRTVRHVKGPAEGDALLARGEVQFVLVVPGDFSRKLVRGERPAILLAADATDPAATGNALASVNAIAARAIGSELRGPLARLRPGEAPYEIRSQRRYNPEGLTRYNIVPGLMGVILTMTMVMMTALAMTRERERGTMENLLATPVSPLEVMIGKIVPYILIGYIQVGVILLASWLVFDVPMVGSLLLLSSALVLFIAANLAIGFTFSTIARNQMQAMQLTFFFFLPSMLLTGFMFPFRGMPGWAQAIGEVLPLTHFLRITRGIMLKGNGLAEVLPHAWPIALAIAVAGTVAMLRYRQTLD
ncbi:ABC transporter permease [Massilia pseudoviolaceinigra]|uniref:ABC transporter permease n=1 Tax=Massilia pseudoviolaceinigra TaxID=3057165 RepID=UPI0027964645|nr:ABC transporter permease [Massilia sp. CCM 9206]MDQ1919966.1 ABC transporter permease [Massilia sp. CCM 9206]